MYKNTVGQSEGLEPKIGTVPLKLGQLESMMHKTLVYSCMRMNIYIHTNIGLPVLEIFPSVHA